MVPRGITPIVDKITTVDSTTAPWFTANTGVTVRASPKGSPARKVVSDALPQLIVLGIVAMAGLATLRVVRFRRGLTPLPDVRGRRLLLFAFVVVPPIVLGGIGALPEYVAIIAALAILMWIAALIVGMVSNGRTGRLVQIALAGREEDPYAVRADAPVTEELAESVRIVDRANAAFPRGAAFPAQVVSGRLPGGLGSA